MGGKRWGLALGLLFFLLVSASAVMECGWEQCTLSGPITQIELTSGLGCTFDNGELVCKKFLSTENYEFGGVDEYVFEDLQECLGVKVEFVLDLSGILGGLNLVRNREESVLNCLFSFPELEVLDKLAKVANLALRLKVELATFIQNIEPPRIDRLEFTSETASAKFESVESEQKILVKNWDEIKSPVSLTANMIKSAQEDLEEIDSIKCVKESLDKAAQKGKSEFEKSIPKVSSKIASKVTK